MLLQTIGDRISLTHEPDYLAIKRPYYGMPAPNIGYVVTLGSFPARSTWQSVRVRCSAVQRARCASQITECDLINRCLDIGGHWPSVVQ